jgi:hypothetical protein
MHEACTGPFEPMWVAAYGSVHTSQGNYAGSLHQACKGLPGNSMKACMHSYIALHCSSERPCSLLSAFSSELPFGTVSPSHGHE